jgi:hypothetical protein
VLESGVALFFAKSVRFEQWRVDDYGFCAARNTATAAARPHDTHDSADVLNLDSSSRTVD